MKSTPVIRTAYASRLGLLLPLLAGSTLARATAMARHGTVVTAAKPAAESVRPMQAHAQAGHHGHGARPAHDGAHAHHGEHGPAAQAQHGDGKTATHQSVHAKAGCADCAKCCLLAASAPPPALVADFAPAVARALFLSQSTPVPAFLTDGPDRPPRHFIA